MPYKNPPLQWLEPGQLFPPVTQAWGLDSEAPGLLCAGSDLEEDTLHRAYSNGIFPWYSQGQPILWWSPTPRMVLHVDEFRLHPSFRKSLRKFAKNTNCEIRVDSVFEEVMQACSTCPRTGQAGTWILPEMIQAYIRLHRAGFAHSVEAWRDEQLIGGLYFVNLGQMVFGESMFHNAPEGSKIALAALVAMCLHHSISRIDCQQNTRHLASLGAREIPRSEFANHVKSTVCLPMPDWTFAPVYWRELATLNL